MAPQAARPSGTLRAGLSSGTHIDDRTDPAGLLESGTIGRSAALQNGPPTASSTLVEPRHSRTASRCGDFEEVRQSVRTTFRAEPVLHRSDFTVGAVRLPRVTHYSVEADKRSSGLAAWGAPLFVVIAVVVALGRNSQAGGLPSRLGPGGMMVVAVGSVLVAVVFLSIAIGARRADGQILVLADEVLEVQTKWRRVRIPVAEVSGIRTVRQQGGERLRVARTVGRSVSPILVPGGKTWGAVALELESALSRSS